MPPSRARPTLLVVDDEEIVRDLLARTFAESYEVRTAASGSEALAQLALGRVDLLITDQKMPGLTGIELITRAREIQPDLEAIVLSAYTDPQDLIQAINEGRVYRYVTKPWDTHDLTMTVRNALEAVALKRERDGLVARLERRLEALTILSEVTSPAGSPRSFVELIDGLTQSLHRIVRVDLAASLIVLGDPRRAAMHIHCQSPADEATLVAARDRVIELADGLTGGELREGELVVNLTGERLPGGAARAVASAIHIPLMVDGKPVGVIYLAAYAPDAFSADDQKLLSLLANQASDAVRRLALRLDEERRKMALMVESMADGVVMTDESNEVYLVNPAARRLLGIAPSQEVTTRFLKEKLGFYPFDLVRGWEMSGAEPLREEIKIGEKIVHSILSPVLERDGKLVGTVVVLRDITEQKELERRKDEFVSIVSHELRTPLTSIAGALDIVLKSYAGGLNEKQHRYLGMAREGCGKLNLIVDDLLDVAKFERGKLVMRLGTVWLDALVRDAAEKYRPAAEEKEAQLVVACARPTAPIVGDADRLMQVLGNLLSNAIKFAPPKGGRIEVEVFGPSITQSHVGVSVWNNGEAIPAAAQERVFEKFEQVRSEGTRHIGGTGLGLAISRGIVEAHGGRIWVEDTAGQGAKFVFTLPAAPDAEKLGEPEPGAEAGPRRHVLVVDDDRATTYILKGLFIAAGYRVTVAHDGESALAAAREKHPDLCTVDLRMPGVDGFQLVEILKHDPETNKLPVIVLTVLEDRDHPVLAGADACLGKPVNVEELLATAARLVAERGRAHQAKILVVDDDPGIRMICQEVLENAGYAVREAENGAAALAEAKRLRPDLVLLDVSLPELDGFAVAKRLREERATALTPFIFISAHGQTKDKVRAFKLGADDYLVKPFDAAELQARVEKALERREREYGSSPTTRLPGSQAIEQEIARRLQAGGEFAFCYLDLDNLKAVNDYYGYAKADGIIKQTGDLIREVVAREGNPNDFIGHIAGDDFVFITTPARVDRVCGTLIETFDRLVPLYYNKTDRERGYIETLDRYGERRKFPIMSVSIVALCDGHYAGHADVAVAAAELKRQAKAIQGSAYVRDGTVVVPRQAGVAAG
jgi:PAS domain S-box-containing protein